MSVSIQAFRSTDLGAVLSLLRDAMPADPISDTRFTRQVLLDPNFRPDGALVAVDDDRDEAGDRVAIGFCLSLARQVPLENAPSDAERGYVTLIAVAPDRQRRGIGTRLLQAAESYLKSQGRSVVMVSSYAPGYFIPGVDVHAYAGGLAFFKKHGYVEISRPLAMQTSLRSLVWPAWVREKANAFAVLSYEPSLTLRLLEFVQREFPGDWVRVVRETAANILAGDSSSRLLTAIDRATGEVVGFAHHQAERFGPIGVAASQRGRGVGQVLMFATLAAQRDAGLGRAWFLWSDDKTAERIYKTAGFRETRRFALMKKTLA